MPGREIINVTEADFEYEVIAYSKNTPVVVDFWASWCQPCKVLTPLLEKLVGEMGGSFRLAKVDVDANPNLAARFNVRSIPTVIAFTDSTPREQLIGLQSEPRLRAFLEAIVPPSPTILAIEKANGLLAAHNWVEAETEFRQILTKENDIPACLLGLSIAQLAQGKASEGRLHLYNFPASKEFTRAETLIPYADALIAFQENALPQEMTWMLHSPMPSAWDPRVNSTWRSTACWISSGRTNTTGRVRHARLFYRCWRSWERTTRKPENTGQS